MKLMSYSIVCAVSWACVLGACAPAAETEGLPNAESEVDLPDIEGIGEVSPQTFVSDLGTVVGSGVATYNTCSASNQWKTTCGYGWSRDISYLWTVPSAGDYWFSTAGSDFDTILEARNYQNTSEVLKCDDDAGASLHSWFRLNGLTKGKRILLTIEGYDGDCGNARLSIGKY